MNWVRLTYPEILTASHAGCMRHVENLKDKRPNTYGASHETSWQIHIQGCLGEMAFAKYYKLYWSGKGVFGGPDVGEFEVRTAYEQHHCLILHKSDKNDSKYWLVCGYDGLYSIKGWIFAKDGKLDKYWKKNPTKAKKDKDKRPAYFVPQSILNKPENMVSPF